MDQQNLSTLLKRIESSKGADPVLDREIEKTLCAPSDEVRDYTASIDRCLDLMHEILPAWHWHVGRGANGVMPYASMTKGTQTLVADGTTVPLVLLAVMIKAKQAES